MTLPQRHREIERGERGRQREGCLAVHGARHKGGLISVGGGGLGVKVIGEPLRPNHFKAARLRKLTLPLSLPLSLSLSLQAVLSWKLPAADLGANWSCTHCNSPRLLRLWLRLWPPLRQSRGVSVSACVSWPRPAAAWCTPPGIQLSRQPAPEKRPACPAECLWRCGSSWLRLRLRLGVRVETETETFGCRNICIRVWYDLVIWTHTICKCCTLAVGTGRGGSSRDPSTRARTNRRSRKQR